MPNTRSFCFTASSKKQRPSILKGGVDDAVGRGGLRLETHSQIAPGAAPAAQPDMKKESAKGVPLEEIELLNVTSTKGVPTAEIHQRPKGVPMVPGECPIPGVFASLHPQKSNAPPF
jgi:hypothetical protein